MSKALEALRRLREVRKRAARLEHAEAVREQREREGKVISLEEALARSRLAEAQGGPTDAAWLAQEHAWRLRTHHRLQGARDELREAEAEAERRRDRLVEADREARVVELALDRLEAERLREERRAESNAIDEVAADRWRRRGA